MIVTISGMSIQEFNMRVLPINQRLYHLAYRYLKSAADAEDAVQDVFAKLWAIRDKLDGYKSIEAFAYTVTKNHCLDKLKAKRTYSMEDTLRVEPRQKSGTPLTEVEVMEKFKLVKQIIETLPDQQRIIIKLRDFDELSFDEIAERLDMEVNAIRVNLSRARKKVREQIEKIYEYEVARD